MTSELRPGNERIGGNMNELLQRQRLLTDLETRTLNETHAPRVLVTHHNELEFIELRGESNVFLRDSLEIGIGTGTGTGTRSGSESPVDRCRARSDGTNQRGIRALERLFRACLCFGNWWLLARVTTSRLIHWASV